jgi:hypothetical protein
MFRQWRKVEPLGRSGCRINSVKAMQEAAGTVRLYDGFVGKERSSSLSLGFDAICGLSELGESG